MKASPTSATWTILVPTAHGVFTATFSTAGLREMNFPPASTIPVQPYTPPEVLALFSVTRRALEEALDGQPIKKLPTLDWSGHTEFQQNVWQALCAIPPGSTRTYAEIANEIGSPKALRAVGNACGSNPIPVVVPCHRVLAAGKRLGGFSGGLEWKRKLLAIECSREIFD
jgi:O-6-methylguanine DNA methyltransferase